MLNSALCKIRHVALDLDGTLYSGKTVFPFTGPFLDLLRSCGVGRSFLTNNCSRSVADYVRRLNSLGIPAGREDIQTSALAAVDYLRTSLPEVRKLFVLGTASLCMELRELGFEPVFADQEPDGVLVAFDTELNFERLCRAARWIREGKPFVATHPDLTCPTDEPTVLVDCGSLTACLTAATGVSPLAVPGKPHPGMLQGLLRRHNLKPWELAVVGDRLHTDVEMARVSGAFGVLVLTGETTSVEAQSACPAPDLVVESVAEFGELLSRARTQSEI
ncbi:MAG: HAD-IIA family hydrolase [Armatimonadetes bacterium]|nr:HAD-IIA family hydrolase [Armatimonadota bacterium]